jgi:hypothetical protein
MKLPRPRFTIRRLMIMIVLVSLILAGLGLMRRREILLDRSAEHFGPAAMEGSLVMTEDGPAYTNLSTEKGQWHEAMRRKYLYYGHRPWLSVPPDPPEPE